jgi:hypothetical protein
MGLWVQCIELNVEFLERAMGSRCVQFEMCKSTRMVGYYRIIPSHGNNHLELDG